MQFETDRAGIENGAFMVRPWRANTLAVQIVRKKIFPLLTFSSLFRCLGRAAALFSGARSTSEPQRPGWFSIAKEPLTFLYGEV